MTPARTQPASKGASSLRRLRTATFLLFSGFAVLVTVAGIYYLDQQHETAVDGAIRTAGVAVDTVQYQAAQTFGETLRMTEGMADVYREQLSRNQVSESVLHPLMARKLPRMQGLFTFTIFDADHNGVAGSRTYPVDVSPLISSGMSFDTFTDIGDDMFFGQVYQNVRRGTLEGAWLLPFGKVVRDGNDIVRGYVVALFEADYFKNYYSTLNFGPHGKVSIWSANGRMLAGGDDESRGTVNAAMADEMAMLRRTTDGKSVRLNPSAGASESKVIAYGTVGSLPFLVAVELDGRDFLAAWRAARNQIILAIFGVIMSATIFAVIILRQLDHTEQNERALRHAKAVAEEANDAKSRFLAHMSHEFRTPLNAIMGFSEIIKNRVLGGTVSPDYVGYAAHIHRSGEHLLHIVNEILDTAKIESGGQPPLQQQEIDIRTVILGATSFIEGLAAEKEIKLRVAMPGELPAISGDERLSRQVLINLLSNAVKFSPAGGEIVVSARHTAEAGVTIAVSDHGPGIDSALLRRLGEPFLQGNPALSHSGQGTGLGLSICNRYMDLLGGELKVESVVGNGTTATIRFPRHLIVTAEAAAPQPAA